MLGHHGFWSLSGASQLGLLNAPAKFVVPANVSATATVVQPSEGMCTDDGQLVWHGGAWTRRRVGEVCSTFVGYSAEPPRTGGGGVAVTDVVCTPQPADSIMMTIDQTGNDPSATGWIPTQNSYAGPSANFSLAPNEGDPITYYMNCSNPNLPGFARNQLNMVAWAVQNAMVHRGLGAVLTGSDQIDMSTLFGPGWTGKAWKDLYQGTAAIFQFKTPDGDIKNVFLTMGFDQGMNTFTFRWSHQDTVFQAVDNFVTSISPWDPSGTLCELLPVATKVPNPYVAAGSIVLQLSGKCNETCPQGMLYDKVAKTCSCPPGYVYNTASKICMAVPPPIKQQSTSTIPPWMVAVGVVVGLGLMSAIFSKPAQHA